MVELRYIVNDFMLRQDSDNWNHLVPILRETLQLAAPDSLALQKVVLEYTPRDDCCHYARDGYGLGDLCHMTLSQIARTLLRFPRLEVWFKQWEETRENVFDEEDRRTVREWLMPDLFAAGKLRMGGGDD